MLLNDCKHSIAKTTDRDHQSRTSRSSQYVHCESRLSESSFVTSRVCTNASRRTWTSWTWSGREVVLFIWIFWTYENSMLRHRNDVISFERRSDLKTTIHHSTMTNVLWYIDLQRRHRLLREDWQAIQAELFNSCKCVCNTLNYWWNGERRRRVPLIPGRYSRSDVRQLWSYCCTQRFFRYEYAVHRSNQNRWQAHHRQSIVIQDESILHHEDDDKPCEESLTDVIQATEASRASRTLLLTHVRRCAQRVRRRWSDVKVFRSSSESMSVQSCWRYSAGFYLDFFESWQ